MIFEAIEVMSPQQLALFPYEKESFVSSKKNDYDENQNLHFCGDYKTVFYNLLG